jgi:hypothetical protein
MKYELMMIVEDNTELKVLFDQENEIDEAIESLNRIVAKYRLHSIKDTLIHYWDVTDGSRTLSNQIHDTTHRLVICLLDVYPNSKPTSLIAQEVRLTEGAASNNLGGRYGGSGHLFERTADGWRLSEEGLGFAISVVLPEYQSSQE